MKHLYAYTLLIALLLVCFGTCRVYKNKAEERADQIVSLNLEKEGLITQFQNAKPKEIIKYIETQAPEVARKTRIAKKAGATPVIGVSGTGDPVRVYVPVEVPHEHEQEACTVPWFDIDNSLTASLSLTQGGAPVFAGEVKNEILWEGGEVETLSSQIKKADIVVNPELSKAWVYYGDRRKRRLKTAIALGVVAGAAYVVGTNQ